MASSNGASPVTHHLFTLSLSLSLKSLLLIYLDSWIAMIQRGAENTENSLEKIKRQLASGSGRNLLQGPLLKRSETVSLYPFPFISSYLLFLFWWSIGYHYQFWPQNHVILFNYWPLYWVFLLFFQFGSKFQFLLYI